MLLLLLLPLLCLLPSVKQQVTHLQLHHHAEVMYHLLSLNHGCKCQKCNCMVNTSLHYPFLRCFLKFILKTFNESAPLHISELLTPYTLSRSLRSAENQWRSTFCSYSPPNCGVISLPMLGWPLITCFKTTF